jgi:DNA-directed RNA polymerase subunit RPC12/RpoP
MALQRFRATTTAFVNAADAGEAALIIERDLAGRFDSDLVSVSAHLKCGDGSRCPACGSERIEHHEDIVARRHIRRVRADGVLVFDGFTDSFDDDGMRPRLWCGDCSQEWDLPEQGVEFE